MPVFDVAIVGGGIVGLATATEFLSKRPTATLTVLEKERQVGSHQTTHNSGVIHSGIYYRPGSLKAKACVAGAKLMIEFCQAHQIPHAICGKVIVATEESELPRLHALYERGLANGVPGVSMIGPERLRDIEPHARGLKALHVRSAGIVDYGSVARVMAECVRRRGGTIQTSAAVHRTVKSDGVWILETTAGDVRARFLVTCGGLYADRLTALAGGPRDLLIIPFRGEYYEVVAERRVLVNTMIYPVPDPALPFLGVHFTRTVSGALHAGPNAVLALKREGYRKRDVSVVEALRVLTYPGFWRMASRHWLAGMQELYRSWSKRAFVHALQRLVPEVRIEDLVPGGAGVRAQALNVEGLLIDDFNVVQQPQAIHVRNVPSPAATASIPIGRFIADLMMLSMTP